MIEATNQWLTDFSNNADVQNNINKMLKIHEKNMSIGNAVRFE
jgi:hypothetical protein